MCVGKRKDGAEKGLGPVFDSEPWSFGSSLWRVSTNWVTPEKSLPVFGLKESRFTEVTSPEGLGCGCRSACLAQKVAL